MYNYDKIQRSNRLGPVIDLLAAVPGDLSRTSACMALVDTGATITCVPEKVILGLGRSNLIATVRKVSGAFGEARPKVEKEAYVIDIKLGNCQFKDVEVVVLPPDKDYALIGRDILNGYKITFDAPNRTWTVAAQC